MNEHIKEAERILVEVFEGFTLMEQNEMLSHIRQKIIENRKKKKNELEIELNNVNESLKSINI